MANATESSQLRANPFFTRISTDIEGAKTMKTKGAGLLALILVCVLLVSRLHIPLSLEYYLLSHTNRVETVNIVTSPEKDAVVEVFHIYGGATATDVTQVFIRSVDQPQDLRNNFCLLSVEGLKDTKITWTSNNHILIEYQSGTVYKSAAEWGQVSINYKEL